MEQQTAPPLAVEQAEPVTGGPKRVLGMFDTACIVIGAIIGVGIFFSPGGVVRVTGSGTLALVAWGVAGVMALCGALVFAELGSRFHSSGAQYEILRGTYGRLPAFVYVFCNATAIQAGAVAIIAVICVNNLAVMLGRQPPEGVTMLGVASLLIAGVMAGNIVGVRVGSSIQNLTVISKVFTLLVLTGVAVFASSSPPAGPDPSTWSEGHHPVVGVMAALASAFFAFGGWQHALWISGEVKNPGRTLPRAIFGGVVVVVVVYLLANWAYLALLGAGGVATSKALAADAVATAWPKYGARVIAGAVAISAAGVLNAQLLSGPRLVYRMATEGQFFASFGRLGRFGTPVAAILLIGVMAVGLLAAVGQSGADQLSTGVVFIDGVFFGLTAISLLVIRKKEKAEGVEKAGVFRVPLYPVIPLVFIVGELALLVGSYLDAKMAQAAWIGVAWMVVAGVLYAVKFGGKDARAR